MQSEHPILVIGRSFGAGGRSIGRELSTLLGYPLYDSELLKESASEFGFAPEIFAKADERPPSFFKRLVTQSYGLQEVYMPVTLSGENLYHAQSRVIRHIASRGPAIIVGRTADYILRDFPSLVSVFIHAPLAYRAVKIVERGDAGDTAEAIELAKIKDRRRQEYYNYFTGRQWGMASNYDLTLDSSLLSPRENAELIEQFCKKRLSGQKNVKSI